jgi:hypothetical protein
MITEVVVGQQLWAGVDAGKSDHHCVVIDAAGRRLLSQRVPNDEVELLELIKAVTTLADGGEVTWAIDLNHGGAALLIALLIAADQRLLYIPGRTVYHASGGYRGEGKTDAKDAAVIADQARMRRDLQPLRPGDGIAVDLRILTARRTRPAVLAQVKRDDPSVRVGLKKSAARKAGVEACLTDEARVSVPSCAGEVEHFCGRACAFPGEIFLMSLSEGSDTVRPLIIRLPMHVQLVHS